jgi:hypothetical protein
VTERVLTSRDLNRALLARQRLLERSHEPIPRVLERMGGLQAQYAPSMYIGLWSRAEGVERDALTAALERRAVIQGTLLRSTIHLVSRRDWWPFAVAVRRARRAWWLRTRRGAVGEADMERAAARLREHLGDDPLPRKAVVELVGKERFEGIGLWVDLVRAPPSGTWERRRADTYALASDWIIPVDITREGAIEHLVRRYLGGFGPATAKDVISFTGLSAADLTPLLDRLELPRFRSEDGDPLLDLPGAPLPDPDTPAPVRFLGTWDASLLAHARRTGVLPEAHRPRIFHTKAPQSFPTFLVDGAVAGTWRSERGAIALDPFEPLDAAARGALAAESERLTALHA